MAKFDDYSKKWWFWLIVTVILFTFGFFMFRSTSTAEEPKEEDTEKVQSSVVILDDSTLVIDGKTIPVTPKQMEIQKEYLLKNHIDGMNDKKVEKKASFWTGKIQDLAWTAFYIVTLFVFITRILPWLIAYFGKLFKGVSPDDTPDSTTTATDTASTPKKDKDKPATAPTTTVAGSSPWWPLKFALAFIIGLAAIILATTFTSGDARLNSLKNGKGFGGFINIIWDVFTHRISSDDDKQTKVVTVTPYPDPKALLNVEIGSNNKKVVMVSKEEQEKAIADAVAAALLKKQQEEAAAAVKTGTAPTGTTTQYAEATMYTVP